MMITSVFLITSHWEANNDKVFAGIVAVCLIVLFNLTMLWVKAIPTPWGTIPARSDAFDTIRWCINFPIDIFILWSIDAHLASVVSIWLLLTFAAMTEVYAKRYKAWAIAVAFICFLILIGWVYPTEWSTQVYLIACYLSLVFTLWKLQQYVGDEMLLVYQEKIERERIQAEAETLQRDAAIGYSTRAINHEINTLISVANISAYQIQAKNQLDAMSNEVNRLNKSLNYMEQVSSLILDGLGNRNAAKRKLSIGELYADLKLLLGSGSKQSSQQIHYVFPDNTLACQFEERTGSTYLILHNLVKNAYEAIHAKYGQGTCGEVTIEAWVEEKAIYISVSDNGIGMSHQEVNNILTQTNITPKLGGHGLGTKFVTSECEKNGMGLSIKSKLGEYSVVTIQIQALND